MDVSPADIVPDANDDVVVYCTRNRFSTAEKPKQSHVSNWISLSRLLS